MALKRKEKKTVSLPNGFNDLLQKGFTSSVLAKHFKEESDDCRKEIKDYINDNSDGFDMEITDDSKSFSCDYGKVTYVTRSTDVVDKDELIALVNSGDISIATIISVASISANKLSEGLPDSLKERVIVQDTPKEYVQLKPSDSFVEIINETFDVVDKGSEKPKKPKVKKVKEEVVEEEVSELNSILGIK